MVLSPKELARSRSRDWSKVRRTKPSHWKTQKLPKTPKTYDWNRNRKPRFGSKSPNWRGGITTIERWVRVLPQYYEWRSKCMERDGFKCQVCEQIGGNLQVHHIKPVAIIIKENKILTKDDAINCKELWNVNNGITLSFGCHKDIHRRETKW